MNSGVYVQALCPGLTKTDLHEKMGMPKERQQNRGVLHWQEPEQVVSQSVKAMKKKKAICISGRSTKLLIFLTSCMPQSLYNPIANSVFK
jgi:short-subunit dehydrogenase